jgi:hypothetical protein
LYMTVQSLIWARLHLDFMVMKLMQRSTKKQWANK